MDIERTAPGRLPFRLPVVGVMGSGADAHDDLAIPVGRLLASSHVHLLTGGGGGVMESVSRAFIQTPGRLGLTIGVLPGDAGGRPPRPGYPNPWVEVVIRTHLPLTGEQGADPRSRNHVNVLTSRAIVVLPGGPGTATEVALASGYGVPIVAFDRPGSSRTELPAGVLVTASIDELASFLRARLGERATVSGP